MYRFGMRISVYKAGVKGREGYCSKQVRNLLKRLGREVVRPGLTRQPWTQTGNN